jgi:hypothetical protein
MGFCLGMHEDLVLADRQLALDGGCAKGDMDDVYMLGTIETVLPAALAFADRLEERAGIQLNLGKSAIHSTDPARDAAFLALDARYARTFKVGRLDSVDLATTGYGAGYGVMVSGIPVGDEVFVSTRINAKVDIALEHIQKTVTLLRDVHRQSLWIQLLFCLRPKLDFLAQTCHGPAADQAFRRFDSAILGAAGAAAGQSLGGLDVLRVRRLELPARLYGCGLRRLATVAPAAFAGAVCRVVPMMIDRTVDGEVRCGFLTAQLPGLFGAGSFDPGGEEFRFDGMLRSGCCLSSAFTNCWHTMLSSITAARGGLHPTEGPLAAPLVGAGIEENKILRKPQSAFTSALELAWFDALDAGFKLLPRGDVARVAWLNADRFSTQFVNAIPSSALGFVLGNDAFAEVFATYLALPSPACAPLVGQRVGRYRDVLDPHGVKLTTLPLPGDGWRTRHDAVKHLVDRDIRQHGVPSSCEVFGLFAQLLPQQAREAVKTFSARKRQGLVPDFRITHPHGLEALMELKLISGPTWYAHGDTRRCQGVARRARALPGEYAAKARSLDAQFCGVSRDAEVPGPIAQKLLSYGRLRCLVFGALGEASEDVHSLVDLLAGGRASRDWVRMGCRSSNDAKASLARYLYRSWGLMAVRGQACLKLSGLAHVGPGAQIAADRRALGADYHQRARIAYQLHHRSGRF